MPTIFGMFFSINEGFKTPNLNFTIKLRFDSRPNHLDLPSDRVWVKLCRSATEVIVTVENLLRPLSVIVEYWGWIFLILKMIKFLKWKKSPQICLINIEITKCFDIIEISFPFAELK